MRHRKKGRTLGRESAAKKALLRGLATNFLIYEKIKTTQAKAKEIQPVVEKLITIAKIKNLTNIRKLNDYLYTENAVSKAVNVIGPRYKDRQGGYTRIIKIGPRQGDGAQMVQLELI